MSEKTIEEKFKELYPYTDINSEESVGSYYCFEEGYKLAKKELEEQLKESREVIRTLLRYSYITEFPDDNYEEEELAEIEDDFRSAKAYLEKWR